MLQECVRRREALHGKVVENRERKRDSCRLHLYRSEIERLVCLARLRNCRKSSVIFNISRVNGIYDLIFTPFGLNESTRASKDGENCNVGDSIQVSQ